MTATTIPSHDPDQSQITLDSTISPYSFLWWTGQTITNIPADSVGWLVAQGWQITDVALDTSTVPSTPSYAMYRESLQNWLVLQSLLNSYTTAYNEARWANSLRYNEVIANWTQMLSASESYLGTQNTEQNAHVVTFAANLDTYMSAVETLVAANETAMAAAVTAAETLIGDTNTLTTAHGTAYDALLDQLATDYGNYEVDFSSVLGQLPLEYDVHAATARTLLTGLGATELARINEEYAATLATQLQQLVDQGTYTSLVAVDITARNARDRGEAITALNDRLNREKLENQHQLYGQQIAVRGREMDGEDRLYERQTAMRVRTIEGKDRIHALKQELLKYRIAQEIGNAEVIAKHKHQAVVEYMNAYAARLEGLQRKHTENMQLMAYQMDTRNQLLIGLYGFVERREDVAPRFEELSQVVTALGDAGGGWVTP